MYKACGVSGIRIIMLMAVYFIYWSGQSSSRRLQRKHWSDGRVVGISSPSMHLTSLDSTTSRQAFHRPLHNSKNHEHMQPLLTSRTYMNFPLTFYVSYFRFNKVVSQDCCFKFTEIIFSFPGIQPHTAHLECKQSISCWHLSFAGEISIVSWRSLRMEKIGSK
jgi:hypothetical protein